MTREKALDLLHSKMQSPNLRKHCYAVETVMRALAKKLEGKTASAELVEAWGIVGLLHDGDYEFTKEHPEKHAKLMAQWAAEAGETNEEVLTGIESHGWFHQGKLPKTTMQWALYCCDELTGFIIAVALVRPDKKLSSVTVESVIKKWSHKEFAKGVDRKQIEMCEEKLGIKLPDFIGIALKAMQEIANDLGL
ncbi:MAG: metal dependent phosphohydrolase [uncultured bacterium]|uniref:HD domain-containing protein n=1 Tax=Candidatus Woesebacteria bacterium RIFCSPHIGHO2_12_FULL_41_24 TaxID=1802510 RepID=A0A1F8AU01_9BACT|nr:MAG: metal dependent phosphohydrolase [uncultured bacterium]OGM14150.1 MAG: hypothetical protein A2W15_03725 [Candidatus Woesebacteria bacterium RBG_16_41_13]OGM35613.1 MAG: hypothetical protein A3D84_03575 [Candidatus Woesebacteria bacterium RIFCSPHIGHO2_02_FULL_42_20]OGM55224.1 MAG: hypothetical protein A3E44_02985 [Candidatus Woesebacteria bacterium RIFCSPHIGHO2_12_FULL_41_24]OGM67178.1 MAG: hypothetical protein A2969_04710 [Candidatus Woesebacteria bacterium RIFCSPLOWO2_01_FULL_42_67]OG